MRPQTILIASTICAALTLAAPAQAGGFNFGLFMGGSTWQMPKCKAPQALREIQGPNGKTQWRCVAPPAVASQGGDVKSASNARR